MHNSILENCTYDLKLVAFTSGITMYLIGHFMRELSFLISLEWKWPLRMGFLTSWKLMKVCLIPSIAECVLFHELHYIFTLVLLLNLSMHKTLLHELAVFGQVLSQSEKKGWGKTLATEGCWIRAYWSNIRWIRKFESVNGWSPMYA